MVVALFALSLFDIDFTVRRALSALLQAVPVENTFPPTATGSCR